MSAGNQKLLVLITIVSLVFGIWMYFEHLERTSPKAFSNFDHFASPGTLSHAHRFLSDQCTACHTPNHGVQARSCILCHSMSGDLLKRKSTQFHANISSCVECHNEHQGGKTPPLAMDHAALARIGIKKEVKEKLEIVGDPSFTRSVRVWNEVRKLLPSDHSNPDRGVVTKLDCYSCHQTQDRHQGQFGKSCLACHSTTSWRVAEYRHPSPSNRSCMQCHDAPPSHYMEHFRMISQRIAGQYNAKVNQCFLCHKTTSWNDIQGVGWYKHH